MKQIVAVMVGEICVALMAATAFAQQLEGASGAAPALSCATSGCHLLIREHRRLHQPVETNRCDACHEPKEGATPFQAGPRHEFKRAGANPELCYACHDRVDQTPFVHKPVKMGVCTLCHDPHGAEYASLLRVDTDRQLCVQCHRLTLDQGDHVHPPVSSGTCGACHNPHGSDQEKFLRSAPPELCLDCHDAIEDLLDDASGTHGALTTGQSCTNCHNPHAGTFAGLLTKANPKGPYFPFQEEAYALCFDCHEVEMVEEEDDPEVTEFRNGDLNLHYRHVNRQEKGCTCDACHNPHAGAGPQHMADSTIFGPEAILTKYESNATGGSCVTKCHATRGYDRVKAVQNK